MLFGLSLNSEMNVIIYFHGYKSDGNSRTAEIIRQIFTNYHIISPSYNTANADEAFEQLSKIIDEGCKICDCIYLIGNSLGGFWANFFSDRYKIKTLLINPSLDPVNSLKKYGDVNCETYNKYYLQKVDGIRKVVILGKNDETIPFESFLKEFENKKYIIHLNENMGHRVESKEQILPGMYELINFKLS